jgi:hypothetical protein
LLRCNDRNGKVASVEKILEAYVGPALACPKVKEAELYWRLHCVYGAMLYLRANNGRVARILGRKAGPLDARAVRKALRYVVPFLAAGLSRSPLDV